MRVCKDFGDFSDSADDFNRHIHREEAFHIRQLFEIYYDSIYQYIYYLTNNRDAAEDFVQETFIRYGRMQSVENPKAVLYRIARNLVYDYSKRKKLLQWVPIIGDQYKDTAMLPEEIALKGEEVAVLYDALRELRLNYREVIVLRYIEECSVAETALLLGLSEVQVKNYTARGFKVLRERLGGDVDGMEAVENDG